MFAPVRQVSLLTTQQAADEGDFGIYAVYTFLCGQWPGFLRMTVN